MKLIRGCCLHIASETRSHSGSYWIAEHETRAGPTSPLIASRTEAVSRVFGNNSLGVQMLRQRARSLISVLSVMFAESLDSFLFLGVWLIAGLVFSIFLDVPAFLFSPFRKFIYFFFFKRQLRSAPTVASVCADILACTIFRQTSHFAVNSPCSLNQIHSFLLSYHRSSPSITPFHSFILLGNVDIHKSALRLAANAPGGANHFISSQNLLLTQTHKQWI